MTPAINAARQAGINYTIHEYRHDPAHTSYGLEAAEKMVTHPACNAFPVCSVCQRSGFCGGRMPDANLMGR
jgi:hypothetical protein